MYKNLQNKKIALVANTTWNIYKFRLNIIKKLLENNNQVIVIAPQDQYINYKEKFPTVKHIPIKQLSRKGNVFKDLKLIFELRYIYKKLKPDMVLHYTHKANIFGGFAKFGLSTKSLAVVTGLGYAFLHKGLIQTITKMLYKFCSKIHDKILFENEEDMNLFIDEGIAKKEKVDFVNGCGVDVTEYKSGLIQRKESKLVFTFIGRLLYDKGILEFIEAAKRIKKSDIDVEFWIIGELDEGNPSMIKKHELLQWIETGVVTYHGFLNDVKPMIEKSDCIVLPSYREGMSRTILEAMSMERAVITSDVPGCRQMVEDGKNGYLVPHKDFEELTIAIQNFIQLTPSERLNMGKTGRKIVMENFNSEKIANELYQIISQVYFCD